MLFWWLSNCWLENDVNISGQTSPFLETFFFLYKKKVKTQKLKIWQISSLPLRNAFEILVSSLLPPSSSVSLECQAIMLELAPRRPTDITFDGYVILPLSNHNLAGH